MFDFVKRLFKKELSPKNQQTLVEEYLQEKVLENGVAKIITSYTNSMDSVDYFINLKSTLEFTLDMFTWECEIDGLSGKMYIRICEMLNSTTDYTLSIKELYEIIVDHTAIPWAKSTGSGRDGYAKIEDLPIYFVRKHQGKIDWYWVGRNFRGYSDIEYLPDKFIKEFGHKFEKYVWDWKKIENIPIEIVRQHKNSICWHLVGTGRSGYAKIETLPIELVREFQHKLDWGGIAFSIPLSDLPIEFVREFQNRIDWPWYRFAHKRKNFSHEFIKEFRHKWPVVEFKGNRTGKVNWEN